MGLKILCAGCSKDEREGAEAVVRRVLADAAARTPWSVSLVKMGAQWQVTVDAPADQIRARTAVAPASGLAAALTSLAARPVVDAPPVTAPPPPTPPKVSPPADATPMRGLSPVTLASLKEQAASTSSDLTPVRGLPAVAPVAKPPGVSACSKCGRGFRVVYEAAPGELFEDAPVACPHCWSLNKVKVGSEAAATGDYRADKVD